MENVSPNNRQRRACARTAGSMHVSEDFLCERSHHFVLKNLPGRNSVHPSFVFALSSSENRGTEINLYCEHLSVESMLPSETGKRWFVSELGSQEGLRMKRTSSRLTRTFDQKHLSFSFAVGVDRYHRREAGTLAGHRYVATACPVRMAACVRAPAG